MITVIGQLDTACFHPLAGKSLKKKRRKESAMPMRLAFPSPCGEKFEKVEDVGAEPVFNVEGNLVSIPLRGKV